MPELMQIGQFARLCGISLRALRLYDEAGVLTPAATSVTTGYRYYSADQLPIARRIGELRRMDLPLVEIRALLIAPEPQQARRRLALHRAHLERQLRATRQALEQLQSLDHWYASQTEEGPMSATKTIFTCSFCAKEQGEVERLIAGPNGVYICDECVALCNQIIATEDDVAAQESGEGAREGQTNARR